MRKSKSISSTTLHFPIVFQAEPEGGFTVIVPSLPGCVTFGKTFEEAKKMAREAIEVYIEDMIADGESLPRYGAAYIGDIEVNLSSVSPSIRA